jgi:hypothetical protein
MEADQRRWQKRKKKWKGIEEHACLVVEDGKCRLFVRVPGSRHACDNSVRRRHP